MLEVNSLELRGELRNSFIYLVQVSLSSHRPKPHNRYSKKFFQAHRPKPHNRYSKKFFQAHRPKPHNRYSKKLSTICNHYPAHKRGTSPYGTVSKRILPRSKSLYYTENIVIAGIMGLLGIVNGFVSIVLHNCFSI